MTKSIGYQYLIEHFSLNVCELLYRSYLTEQSEKKIVARDDTLVVYYPQARIRLASTWQDNLIFALKNEGVNLEVLRALFAQIAPNEVALLIQQFPQGNYARRIWFLYEWLTGSHLEIEDLKVGNYIPLVNEEQQFAYPSAQGERVKRQRIMNNLIGSREFCPMVRLTDTLKAFPSTQLKERANQVLNDYTPDVIYRAIRYLFLKETKSSFAIEHEKPTPHRLDSFVEILSHLSTEVIDKAYLVDLQNQIVDERYAQKSWRTDQVYVGETLTPGRERVHFIAVRPQDVNSIMTSFLNVMERALSSLSLDCVVLAAIFSFAFVFLHPFDDGNGRIHRFLMHYILTRCGFLEKGMIFPISAVLLKDIVAYNRLLESFSRRVMRKLNYDIDEVGEITVYNESLDYYRYIDFTPIVEGFSQIIQETIETEWKSELDYLCEYDAIRERLLTIVDMPEKRVNQFIAFVRQNNGHLSQRKRSFFQELTDDEIARMEEVIRSPRVRNEG